MSFLGNVSGYGAVTVFDAQIIKLRNTTVSNGGYSKEGLETGDFYKVGEVLDSLKISNLNQEGPRKTLIGGQNADPLIKYGKTTRLEMQDALVRKETLENFFGFETIGNNGLAATDKFPSEFGIVGKTYMIDRSNGSKLEMLIVIPQFSPDAILNLALESEGDGAVIDLNGDVRLTSLKISSTTKEGFYFMVKPDDFNVTATTAA